MRRLLDGLGRPLDTAPVQSTVALGDWFVNPLFMRPQWLPLRQRIHAGAVVVSARELATMADRFRVALADVLRALNIDTPFITRKHLRMPRRSSRRSPPQSSCGIGIP